MRHRLLHWSAPLLVAAMPAAAQDVPGNLAGDYVHSQHELVAGLRLNPDGTFEYGLTVGSLDEQARGRWQAKGNRIELTSVPRPVAPTITPLRIDRAPGKPFAVRVVAPNGNDVPGIDILIDFATGEPIDSYTPGDSWSLPAEERRTPRTVTFSKRSYRISSGPLPLDPRPGTVAVFALTPNDFGVADLTGVVGEIGGEDITLRRAEGSMTFTRRKKTP